MSECASTEEFVEAFRGYCDGGSIFVSTQSPKRVGASLNFRLTLANGDPMIVGSGDVVEAYPDARNDLGLPGMRIKFKELDVRSRETVEQFDVSASPNGDSARIFCEVEEENATLAMPALPRLPAHLPRQETIRVMKKTWTPPPPGASHGAVTKNAVLPPRSHTPLPKPVFEDADLQDRTTLPIKKLPPFDVDEDEDTNVTEPPLPPAAMAPAAEVDSGPLTSAPVFEPRADSAAPELIGEPASAASHEDADHDDSGDTADEMVVEEEPIEAAPAARPFSIPAPKPPRLPTPIPAVGVETGWGDIDDWKAAPSTEPAPIIDSSIPEVEVSGEFEIPTVLPPRRNSDEELAAQDEPPQPVLAAFSAAEQTPPRERAPTPNPARPPTPTPLPQGREASHTPVPHESTPAPRQFAHAPTPVPASRTPTPAPYIPTPPPGQFAHTPTPVPVSRTPTPVPGHLHTPTPPPGVLRPVPGHSGSMPTVGGAPQRPGDSASSGPVYASLQPMRESDTSTEVRGGRRLSAVQASAISGGVAALLGLGLGYLIWGGNHDAARSASSQVQTESAGKTVGQVTEAGLTDDDTEPANDRTNESADHDDVDEVIQKAHATSASGHPDALKPAAAESAAGGCSLSVISKPAGASVYIDKDELGTTPYSGAAPCGEIAISIRKAHYGSSTETAVLAAGTPGEVSVSLNRRRYTLSVASTPSGASVTVNGKSIGKTPASTRVPAFAKAKVTVSKAGYKSYSKLVRLKKNERVSTKLSRMSTRKPKKKSSSSSKRR